MGSQLLFYVGIALIFVGFVIVLAAAVLLVFASIKGKGKIKGGGAVVIGPFPIVFGTDKESVKLLLVLSIALIAFLLLVMAFSHYAFR